MFKTVKSKIIVFIILMLAALMTVFISYVTVFRMKTMQLMLHSYAFSVNSFVQEMNEKIIRMEDNSEDLALIGTLYYNTDKNVTLTYETIKNIFVNYENSLGGGIWFKPYVVDKAQKRVCFYVFRNEDNKLIPDETFASEEYDYPNQIWYKQIMEKVNKENNIAWSMPYYENQGSMKLMITVGSGIYQGDKLIGISTVDWDIGSIFDDISQMKPLENGFSFFQKRNLIKDSFAVFANTDYDFIIASNDPYLDNNELIGKPLSSIPWYDKNLKNVTYIDYHGHKYVPYVRTAKNGMMLIICVPKSSMFHEVNRFVLNLLLLLTVFGITIPAFLYWALNHNIIDPIGKLISIAKKVSHGEDVEIKLEKPEEFAQLASTFDKMTHDIKTAAKEKEKLNSELMLAQSIQKSSLPNTFPAFPERTEFDIYAAMDAAKEVGGDFYDFYMLGDNRFMFLIADVSGKGVPAALFMMTVKTYIANLAQLNYSPKELIEVINNNVCKNNKQEFFITMLAGICDIETGKLSLINCGHNLPLIKRQNGDYEYLNLPSNIVLGVFDNAKFEIYETSLEQGDVIFTYTDGVTEATNEKGELFGENNLLADLNSIKDETNIPQILSHIKKSVVEYMGNVSQSDDITMLIFKYQNTTSENEKIFKTDADTKNYKPFYTWLHEVCKDWNIDDELTNKIDMCSEEIFANIAFYAYPNPPGPIEISFKKNEDEFILIFTDGGVDYNPLAKPDPDITLPPEQRPVGGLGIFMVKEMVKDIKYERTDDKNILTLIF